MSEKYYSRLAVNLVLTRVNENGKKQILLQLRQNTGYMDNMYDFACSGHVDKGESFVKALVREAKEEIGINIKEDNLVFLTVNHHYQADHVQLFFTTKKYEGEPTVCEPKECGGLLWAEIDNLPENTIPYVINVIEDIKLGIQYDDGEFANLKKAQAVNYEIKRVQELNCDSDIQDLKKYKTKNRILITGAVLSSDNTSREIYNKIISLIDKNEHEISSPLDTMKFQGNDFERYNRAMLLLRDTKLIIAEMSNISTGQGMELQEAATLNIPILVIAKKGSKISGLVKGCKNVKRIIYYENIEDISRKIKEAVKELTR